MNETFYRVKAPGYRVFFGDRFEVKQFIWGMLARGIDVSGLGVVIDESLKRGGYVSRTEVLDQILDECETLKRA